MEQNQSFSVESMLKCCDVNFSTRTLDKPSNYNIITLRYFDILMLSTSVVLASWTGREGTNRCGKLSYGRTELRPRDGSPSKQMNGIGILEYKTLNLVDAAWYSFPCV